MKYSLSAFSFKQALSIGLSVLLAMIFSYYWLGSTSYTCFLVCFLVTLTTRGTPVRQSIVFAGIIICAMLFAWFLMYQFGQALLIDLIAIAGFVIASYLSYVYRPSTIRIRLIWLYFPLILLIVLFSPEFTLSVMRARVIEAICGAFIGIVVSNLIYPVTFNHDFSKGMLPVLRELHEYMHLLGEIMLHKEMHSNQLAINKIKLERLLHMGSRYYPEWVYEPGFNPGLRGGYRYILVNLDRIIETVFSLDYFISRYVNLIYTEKLDSAIHKVMLQNQELLGILIYYFEFKKIKNPNSNFTEDMKELEESLQKILPPNLDLLDLSPVFLALTSIVRDIRDLRGLLLRLVAALPAPTQLALAHHETH